MIESCRFELPTVMSSFVRVTIELSLYVRLLQTVVNSQWFQKIKYYWAYEKSCLNEDFRDESGNYLEKLRRLHKIVSKGIAPVTRGCLVSLATVVTNEKAIFTRRLPLLTSDWLFLRKNSVFAQMLYSLLFGRLFRPVGGAAPSNCYMWYRMLNYTYRGRGSSNNFCAMIHSKIGQKIAYTFGDKQIGELWSTNKKVTGAHVDPPKIKVFGRLYFGS